MEYIPLEEYIIIYLAIFLWIWVTADFSACKVFRIVELHISAGDFIE